MTVACPHCALPCQEGTVHRCRETGGAYTVPRADEPTTYIIAGKHEMAEACARKLWVVRPKFVSGMIDLDGVARGSKVFLSCGYLRVIREHDVANLEHRFSVERHACCSRFSAY